MFFFSFILSNSQLERSEGKYLACTTATTQFLEGQVKIKNFALTSFYQVSSVFFFLSNF